MTAVANPLSAAPDGPALAGNLAGWIDDGRTATSGLRDVGTSVAGDATSLVDESCIVMCRGTPVFLDADVERHARKLGVASAWRLLHDRVNDTAPTRVHGRFAVVVLNRATGQAFAAVDRFATDSLCFASTETRFAFADRADEVPGAARAIDPQSIFDFLYFHVIPAPRTIFRDVSRLPAGHRLRWSAGRCAVEPYWVPAFDETAHAGDAELREEFRTLLRDAVQRAAATTKPGCYLSGGTDSSTIAGLLGAVTGAPARTYSIGFGVAGYDEMAYARIAARHFDTDHHEYYVTARDIVQHLPRVATHFDQPFGNSSALPAFCCARLAREDGVTRMLAGDGGDELFGGNSRYATQQLFAYFERMPTALRGFMQRIADLEWPRHVPLLRKVAGYVDKAGRPMPDRMEMYNLLLRMGIADILEPDFLACVDPQAPLAAQRATYAGVRAKALINRMLGYDWKYTLADNDLPKVVGSATLAGVDVAFPLLDDRLVEFSLRLAPTLKLKGQELRWFFKAALADFLPPQILAKRKHGFGLPFGTWVLSHAPLREFAHDSLAAFARRGIVRAAFVDDLLRRRLPEHPGYYGEMVWLLMVLEQWLAAHEGARSPGAMGAGRTQ